MPIPKTQKNSFVLHYLGPLVPLGFAVFGVWILISGRYAYRPGRSAQVLVLLPPDSQFAALFFISLACVIAAFGFSGLKERWLFWGGLAGCVGALLIEGVRQLLGLAVYG
ncbi:MAG TPA: hypothetical protein VGJ72_20290 [Polaromonas sp.]|jgi:hypothetical protein